MGKERKDTPWELAQRDPHLMRLGDYLATQMGPEAMAKLELELDLEWEGYGREAIRRRLEGVYQSDMENQCQWHSEMGDQCHWKCHWQEHPQITKIVDPEFNTRPFVVLWTNKDQSHHKCPLYHESKNEENMKHSEVADEPRARLPGKMKEEKDSDDVKRDMYKPWEEHEQGGRMTGVLKWKVKNMQVEGAKKGDDSDKRIAKEKKEKNVHECHKCKEDVSIYIQKMLMGGDKSKNRNNKKHEGKETKKRAEKENSGWQGPRPQVYEEPQKKKKQDKKNQEQKKRQKTYMERGENKGDKEKEWREKTDTEKKTIQKVEGVGEQKEKCETKGDKKDLKENRKKENHTEKEHSPTKENPRDDESEEKQVLENEKSNNNVYNKPPTKPGYIYMDGEQANICLGSSKTSQKVGREGKLENAKEEKKNEHSLIGGGAGEAGEHYLAQQILKGVKRAELPMKLDVLTEGDGNCWYRGIWSQMQREEIRETFTNEKKKIQNHFELRQRVAKFMTRTITKTLAEDNFIENYEKVVKPVSGETWSEYWGRMKIYGEWADDIAVQGTAWYLNRDILIVWSTATLEQPYLTKSGNFLSELTACEGLPLLMGYVKGIHYQSLVPSHDQTYRPAYLQPQSLDEILKEAIKNINRGQGTGTSKRALEDEELTEKRKKAKPDKFENIYIGRTKDKMKEDLIKAEARNEDIEENCELGELGASSDDKEEIFQPKPISINRGQGTGSTKRVQEDEKTTGKRKTANTCILKDQYIGEQAKSTDHINKDEEKRGEKGTNFCIEESEESLDDQNDQFQPNAKLGKI